MVSAHNISLIYIGYVRYKVYNIYKMMYMEIISYRRLCFLKIIATFICLNNLVLDNVKLICLVDQYPDQMHFILVLTIIG